MQPRLEQILQMRNFVQRNRPELRFTGVVDVRAVDGLMVLRARFGEKVFAVTFRNDPECTVASFEEAE